MADDRSVKLQRRQAMKRKGYVYGDQQSMTLSRIDELAARRRSRSSDAYQRRPRGSSLDLTPTLLGIYDKIASANRNGDQGSNDQSECDFFLANEFLQDGLDDRCHSPKSSPKFHRKDINQQGSRINSRISLSHDNLRPISKVDWDVSVEDNNTKLKMESSDIKEKADNENDNKKRPLSISSMSSSSTSSLPRRQRKRQNLCEYSDTSSAGQLDIEKLDNLLYIDDSPENETSDSKPDDELSLYSADGKHKSCGETDSQISADQSSNYGDQLRPLNTTLSFHQSNSSLSYTPSNSNNCSTADLSLNSDLNLDELRGDRPRRSPSRSSQRSPGISRSSSLNKSGHYVSYVQRVVTELVETERVYVKHLLDIKQGYYQYIVDMPRMKISETERECLFGNVVQIYDFSCQFLQELEDCGMDPVKVAECFVQNSDGFVIYAEYCTNYPSAVAVLTKVMHDPQLNETFKQRQLAMMHSLPLGAYLLKPVQRVLKYHLLLQNILKHYSDKDPGHEKLIAALDHMTDMSHHINEMKRAHEHAVRVQEIQSQLEDYEGEDFTRLGELVLEGSFRLYGVKASRQVFLFKKGVIIAKRKEDGMLSCKANIPCANLMLVESIPKEPLNFQILPFDNPRGANTIHARNLDQKRKWCQEIKRLMLESYSSKIPDNVKDLILQKLGKSKEEDNFTQLGSNEPGKSHVSTPDYLEKRMKTRRKSGGTTIIPEILRPQRVRKTQSRSRNEISSPKPTLESLLFSKDIAQDRNNDVEHYGYRTNIPGAAKTQKYNDTSSQAPKRPLSLQRSQSFQTSARRKQTISEHYEHNKERSHATDSVSMDNLSHSDGPVIRTHSFRKATQMAPIRLDSLDDIDRNGNLEKEKNNKNNDTRSVLKDQRNIDNIPPAVRKSIDKELNKLDSGLSVKDVVTSRSNQENLNGSFLDELSLRKRGRYASMPILNSDPPSSPKMSRLCSERSGSPNINHTSIAKSSLNHSKQIDVKPYFSYNRDKLMTVNNGHESDINNLSRDVKPIRAFHDAFTNLRKSQENLNPKTLGTKALALTQPKPFTSTLKHSANILNSQAKLNKWGNAERFTKGSLSDLSHLKEDPWIRDKQRSYTESKIRMNHKENIRGLPNKERSSQERERLFHEKPVNKQIGRLSLDVEGMRHERTRSFTGDDRDQSRDNLDWLVYANRNSIPVSGFSTEEINNRYKYCTPPRGIMEPPPNSKDMVGELAKTPLHQNVISTYGTPTRYIMDQSSFPGYSPPDMQNNNADSSVSLSVTTTSSDTCSSPDILKDTVFDDPGSAEKTPLPIRERSHLTRSHSSSESNRVVKSRKQFQDDRPASADILGDVDHIEDSEKLVAEMEHYMNRSNSSSGSLSSSNNKFPTCIPSFERRFDHRNLNRDSCVSSGSASSYESANHEDPISETQSEEGIVDTIKHKISNITSKLSGKKLLMESPLLHNSEISPPSSPVKYRQEDHPTKLIPTLSHNFSLRMKQGHQKSPEPDLQSILRDKEPGSEAIGSRMANTDLDDYATFSLPRSQLSLSVNDTESDSLVDKATTLQPAIQSENTHRHYGRFSNSNLTCSGPSNISEIDSKFQSQSQSKLYCPVTSLKNLNIQQSDSAFSIQSVEIDSNTSEESPRNKGLDSNDTIKHKPTSKSREGENHDTYYERRLSAVFSSDDAFRDSAVYCDDIDTSQTPVTVSETPSTTKVPIKTYIQQLEEKTKSKPPVPIKVRTKEPSAIIKQKIESLNANVESHNKSTSTSRSISSTTSRTQSRASSRASSEEKQLSSYALKEYMDFKFPMDGAVERVKVDIDDDCDDGAFRSRSFSSSSARLKPAFSLGRLDQLSSDVDNLVIMKGWVKELIGKFQSEK